MQDWLSQCTHIAHFTDPMCPDTTDLQQGHMKKVHPFGTCHQIFLFGTLSEDVFTIETLLVSLRGVVKLTRGDWL